MGINVIPAVPSGILHIREPELEIDKSEHIQHRTGDNGLIAVEESVYQGASAELVQLHSSALRGNDPENQAKRKLFSANAINNAYSTDS